MSVAPLSIQTVLVTAIGALLVGASVSLVDDLGRLWLCLAVLVATIGTYGLVRAGRVGSKDRTVPDAGSPWPIGATYVAGLGTGGLLVLRPGDALTVSDLLFLLSFGLCVLYLIRDVPVRATSPWIGVGVAIFAIGAIVSSIGAPQVGESLGILLRFAFVAWAWLWLGVQVMGSWSRIRIGMAAWAFTGALAATGAVLQAVLGDVIPGTAIAWGRMTGFTQHVNDLGGVCAVALPISIGLVLDATRRHRRGAAVYAALGALNLAGLVLSGSVGGFLAALIGLVVVALSMNWSVARLAATVLASIAASVVVVVFGLGNSVIQRYGVVTAPTGDPTATLWTRLDTIAAAWQVMQRQPLIGVGLSPGGAITETGYAVHNVFIAAWYQAGILGLAGIALLLGVLTAGAFRALQRIRRTDGQRDIVVGVVGSVTAAIVLGLGSPVLYQRYFWLPFAIAAAASARMAATPEHQSGVERETVLAPSVRRHAQASTIGLIRE